MLRQLPEKLTPLYSARILTTADKRLRRLGMQSKFLGLPFVVWGAICLVLAVVWIVFWPSDKAVATEGLRFVILRWFHALVWLLLAIAAFLAASNVLGGLPTARIIALLSLITYLVFIGTVITIR